MSGIAFSRDEAKITLVRVLDKPGIAASIFGPLADSNVNVDMIVPYGTIPFSVVQ